MNWETWTTPAGATLLLAILGGVWRILSNEIRAVRAEAQAAREDLAAYKLEVAKEYASTSHLKEVEIRLVTTIESLTQRIDRLIDRMDRREGR